MKVVKPKIVLIHFFLALITACGSNSKTNREKLKDNFTIEIFALKYGQSMYPAGLLNHETKTGKVSMDWLFFLIKDSRGINLLIDSGFTEKEYQKRFALKNFYQGKDLLAQMGLTTLEITDIIITHSHFDHIGGITQFPRAKLYINTEEFRSFRKTNAYKLNSAYFRQAESQERLHMISTGRETTLHSIYRIRHSGGHTAGSQYVAITGKDEIVFTGDECYYAKYCSLEYPLPPGARYSMENNLKTLKDFQGKTLFTPHDTELFKDTKGPVKFLRRLNFPLSH